MISVQEFNMLKPGMQVKIVDNQSPCMVEPMKAWLGKIVTIDYVAHGLSCFQIENGEGWSWGIDCVDYIVYRHKLNPLPNLEEVLTFS